ncbi:MAG: alcohol dehydrogenase catalytic domain-containing protein [Nitrososphaeraceae archaeon]|jgi:D-arabinose 1-dehydrogenase-like Zn-dependent alcohol dehydrogenase
MQLGKIFDGTCDMWQDGLDLICRNGRLIGVFTNGGFEGYISVPERNVFKIPENLDWDTAASLPYHHIML